MRQPRFNALAISCVAHAIVIGVLLVMSSGRASQQPAHQATHYEPPMMVWLPAPGPGGGGGGGGNNNPNPPRAAELIGTDTMTVPAAPRPAPEAVNEPEPQPTRALDVPVQTFAASDLNAMGLLEAGADSLSQGPGREGGAGDGRGPGIGPGDGPGLGPGRGGNTGGDIFQPGSGVSMPVALHREQPRYTLDAMRARIEGSVVVECVVQPSGECTRLRVVRSLDARLGLDQEALRAAAGWRFSPGVRQGKPVPVLVTIMLGFAIH